MFYYIMGHQQVISHHSIGLNEVHPYFIKCLGAQLECPFILFNTDTERTADHRLEIDGLFVATLTISHNLNNKN